MLDRIEDDLVKLRDQLEGEREAVRKGRLHVRRLQEQLRWQRVRYAAEEFARVVERIKGSSTPRTHRMWEAVQGLLHTAARRDQFGAAELDFEIALSKLRDAEESTD